MGVTVGIGVVEAIGVLVGDGVNDGVGGGVEAERQPAKVTNSRPASTDQRTKDEPIRKYLA